MMEILLETNQLDLDTSGDNHRAVKHADIELFEEVYEDVKPFSWIPFRKPLIKKQYVAYHKPTGTEGRPIFPQLLNNPDDAVIECIQNTLNAGWNYQTRKITFLDTDEFVCTTSVAELKP